jgi:hypothetical protein
MLEYLKKLKARLSRFLLLSKTLKVIEALNVIKKEQINNLNYSVLSEVIYINQLFGTDL